MLVDFIKNNAPQNGIDLTSSGRRWHVFDSLSSEHAKTWERAAEEIDAYERAENKRGRRVRPQLIELRGFPGLVSLFDGQVCVAEYWRA